MGANSKDKRDIYYRLVKKAGYRARSAYKLIHIDEEFNILRTKKYIVDLCSAPGSWSQVLASHCPNSTIISVDLQEIKPIPNVIFIQDDITSESCKNKILNVATKKCDLILCDGAPDVTGMHDLDEYFQTEILLSALSITKKIAAENATFIGKYFRGEDTGYIVKHFKKFFNNVKLVKPRSSRVASIECFIYCEGFKNCDEDPMNMSFEGEPINVSLVACGSGPCADLSFEDVEHIETKNNKPVSAPYKKVIEMRQKANTKKD